MESSIVDVEKTKFPAVRVQRLPVQVLQQTKHDKMGSTEQLQIHI